MTAVVCTESVGHVVSRPVFLVFEFERLCGRVLSLSLLAVFESFLECTFICLVDS